jgi:Golgi phosphoprotein 3 (GPP34)
MAQIAEDLLLLLLDNSSAQPGLDRARLRQVLSGAVLLDLAYGCHIRPTGPGDNVPDGQLIALASAAPVDAVSLPALQLLHQRPLPVMATLSKLGRGTESGLVAALEQSGQLRREVSGPLWRRTCAMPLINVERAGRARAALMSTMFDRQPPTPATAGIITLLHAIDGLGALLSVNDRGWRWVHVRAAEIAGGGWARESATGPAELNLAVTASALRSALS